MDPKSRLARFIRFVTRDTVYHKQYPSTVVRQDGMFVDVLPDDEKIRGVGQTRVPLRIGVPGITCTLADGARVLLSFDNGNPDQPAAALFDPGSVREVVFDGGTQAVSRMGDVVECGGAGTTIMLLPIPPAALGPVQSGVLYAVSFGVPVPPVQPQVPLYGAIITGREEFQA
jgi:hypothetical protein